MGWRSVERSAFLDVADGRHGTLKYPFLHQRAVGIDLLDGSFGRERHDASSYSAAMEAASQRSRVNVVWAPLAGDDHAECAGEEFVAGSSEELRVRWCRPYGTRSVYSRASRDFRPGLSHSAAPRLLSLMIAWWRCFGMTNCQRRRGFPENDFLGSG